MMKKDSQNERTLRVVFPKKGRLKEGFDQILAEAGLVLSKEDSRLDYGMTRDAARSEIDSFETLLQRPSDALANLARGVADLAVVGLDVFEEERARAQNEGRAFNLELAAVFNSIASCALWIAAPQGRIIQSPQDLEGLRIATSYPESLRRWLEENGVKNVTIESCEGGVEDSVRLGIADVVCDIVDSGRTLAANGLQPRLKLFDSSAVMVTRGGAPQERTAQIVGRLLSPAAAIVLPPAERRDNAVSGLQLA